MTGGNKLFFFSLFVTLFCITPHAKAASFQDANDMHEAAGMMENRIVDARIFQKECSHHFPQLIDEIKGHVATWQRTDATEIRKANYYWSVMKIQHPSDTSQINDSMASNAIKVIKATSQNGSNETGLAKFCKLYFANLASGVWRKRTPKMYQYLLNIPDGPSH